MIFGTIPHRKEMISTEDTSKRSDSQKFLDELNIPSSEASSTAQDIVNKLIKEKLKDKSDLLIAQWFYQPLLHRYLPLEKIVIKLSLLWRIARVWNIYFQL